MSLIDGRGLSGDVSVVVLPSDKYEEMAMELQRLRIQRRYWRSVARIFAVMAAGEGPLAGMDDNEPRPM